MESLSARIAVHARFGDLPVAEESRGGDADPHDQQEAGDVGPDAETSQINPRSK